MKATTRQQREEATEKAHASARATAALIWAAYWAAEATPEGRKAHREALWACVEADQADMRRRAARAGHAIGDLDTGRTFSDERAASKGLGISISEVRRRLGTCMLVRVVEPVVPARPSSPNDDIADSVARIVNSAFARKVSGALQAAAPKRGRAQRKAVAA